MPSIATATTTTTGQSGSRKVELITFNACMPATELDALDAATTEDSISRSYAIREGVKLWLRQRAKR